MDAQILSNGVENVEVGRNPESRGGSLESSCNTNGGEASGAFAGAWMKLFALSAASLCLLHTLRGNDAGSEGRDVPLIFRTAEVGYR